MRFWDGVNKRFEKLKHLFLKEILQNLDNFEFFEKNGKIFKFDLKIYINLRNFFCTVEGLMNCDRVAWTEKITLIRRGITTGKLSFENNGRSSRGNVSTEDTIQPSQLLWNRTWDKVQICPLNVKSDICTKCNPECDQMVI